MSDGYQTEGLIYASSQLHWMGDGTGKRLNVPGREYSRNGLSAAPAHHGRWDPRERFFDDIVDAYEVHSKGYPCSCRDALHICTCSPLACARRSLRGGRSSRLGPRTHRQE